MKKKILVFGFGNTSNNLNDVAVCVIDYLRKRSNDNNLDLVDSTSCEHNLSECIQSTDQLIVVDSAREDSKAESVRVYEGIEMDAFVTHRSNINMHESNLRDALSMASLKGKLPRHRALIGIRRAAENDSSEMSNLVRKQTIGRACQKIFEITEYWKI